MKYWKIGLVIWIFITSQIVFGWTIWHILNGGQLIKEPYSTLIINIAKFPKNLRDIIFLTQEENKRSLIKNKNDGQSLTIINKKFHPTGFLLISSRNSSTYYPQIKLFDLKKNKFIKIWETNFKYNTVEITKLNFGFVHPMLLKDSSIIFNSSNLTFKISSKGNLVWKSHDFTHHSLENDKNGFLFIPIHNHKNSNTPNSLIKLNDDLIAKIDPHSGKTIFTKSISKILIENGYKTLLYSSNAELDFLHTNDIQPAKVNSKYWKIGDLLISLRHKSTVFLYRPSTNKILWLKTGPWLNQHDCDFIGVTKIGVFGNDIVRPTADFCINGYNNQYIYNFETNQISTPYTKMFKDANIKTSSQGRSDVLLNEDLYVEETDNGRIIFGNKNGVNAIFVDRMNKDYIAMLGWSRYYSNEEMKAIFKK